MDLNGNYGGLGAAMQAVKWDYYGNGNTVLATYGIRNLLLITGCIK